ncbi:histidine phosphatase family protein [Anaerosalibacter sp. Marseille-P3206]|uniref:histidine phosphatase family protein n=1 Tax=Anaerosalibacter sp. Marseille-P3206 TaxID=1871005 RepID=UPI000985A899|nr:histidine phosphatase family protein [Anaerosalibacter sp. Marseille-P3206]
MQKIYLVRHGQSEWNYQRKVQGQQDILLTELGKIQAKKLGSRLKNEEIDLIYSSDLKRAYETATIIGNELDKKVNKLECFREIAFGKWEGKTIEYLNETSEKEHDIWLRQPHKFNMEGAETLYQLQKRAMLGVNKVIDENPNKNILIVSHGATLKTIILGLLDIDIKYYNKLTLGNVSLSIVEFRDYNRVLKLLNDTNHLREE